MKMSETSIEETVGLMGAALANQDSSLSFAVTLMEHLVVPTFVLDAEQRVLIWNRACERLTGVPAAEVLGSRRQWIAFYDAPRPCLADLVAQDDFDRISHLYTVHEDASQPSFGVHAENWCVMPRRGQRLYLAVDAGPVYDDHGKLIAVIETLRDITEKQLAQSKVMEQAGILKAHYDEHLRETELARRILDHQIRGDLLKESGVNYSVLPAAQFSGDMVLAARSPNGKLYAILADATGHGLAAAVSVLPMVQEFYRLVELGQPLMNLVESINFLLVNSLPLERFVAAAIVCLDEQAGQGYIWVGGVPDVLLFDQAGALSRRFVSANLPLGISIDSQAIARPETFSWSTPSCLLLVSDGVVEATDATGSEFGGAPLIASMAGVASGAAKLEGVQAALQAHLQGGGAHDDMSVLIVDCPVPNQ